MQVDLAEARTLLKLTSRQASERLERLAADKEAQLSSAQSCLADTHRCNGSSITTTLQTISVLWQVT